MSKFSKTTKQKHVCVCLGESVKFRGIISVSHDPPLIINVSQDLSRVSGFATLPIWSIPPMTVCLSIDYIEVTLVALPMLSRGYFVEVILQVS